MSNIVFIENNEVVTDSLMVAEIFGKQHKNILQSIRNLECSKEFNELNFQPVNYIDGKGEKRPKYLIKRDGLSFLVMGFTGEKAAQFKEMYIMEFNRMEQELKNRNLDSFMIDDPIARAEKWIKEQNFKFK
ncbi:transcriptional regulator [Bacillus cereus]|uniref:Rha family transcriptional regulator n=1 Tax=Bacillus cereus group TaxID=86661 RepID=UPI000BAEE460|nr:Rha family transcriptional regulator [Bacillus paranthracis]ASZ15643.1 transcriptional regulator [Bacillus cereus]